MRACDAVLTEQIDTFTALLLKNEKPRHIKSLRLTKTVWHRIAAKLRFSALGTCKSHTPAAAV